MAYIVHGIVERVTDLVHEFSQRRVAIERSVRLLRIPAPGLGPEDAGCLAVAGSLSAVPLVGAGLVTSERYGGFGGQVTGVPLLAH